MKKIYFSAFIPVAIGGLFAPGAGDAGQRNGSCERWQRYNQEPMFSLKIAEHSRQDVNGNYSLTVANDASPWFSARLA